MRYLISFLATSWFLMAQPSELKTATFNIWLFGDVTGRESHERELIFLFTAKNGFSLIQQNRQTSDGASAVGSISAGWKFQTKKHFKQTTTIGPVFGYDPKVSYGGQLVLFSISELDTQFFRLDNIVKLSIPTNQNNPFGSRHIQVVKGPQEGTPRLLRGIALEVESLHINSSRGGWLELRIGPAINVEGVLGRQGLLSHITFYPYRDLFRPQPGHNRIWDLRLQYSQTFHLGK